MIEQFLSTVQVFLSGPGFFVFFAVVFFLSVFLFWRSYRRTSLEYETQDEDSRDEIQERLIYGHRVFDLLILSLITALFVARLTYILSHPDWFSETRWFWLPYERLDGSVFLFSSFPWKFIRLWDGAILLEGLVLGWLVSVAIYSRMMGIRWGSISNAVADFLWVWFIGLELYLAFRWQDWWNLLIVVYLLVLGVVRWWSNQKKKERGFTLVHRSVSVLWKVSVMLGVPLALLIRNLYIQDEPQKEFLLVLNIAALVVVLWVLAGDLAEYISVLRKGVPELVTGIKRPEDHPEETTADGISTSVGKKGWRRFTVPDPISRGETGDEVKRNFSLSYRHFSNNWRDAFSATLTKLRKRRKGNSHEDDT